ncbi:MAG: hypothetical protein FWE32_04600 [Oscillospiraceae bacterium]|nr:hypothetical protein [Oscillospiraceae bacterium]
MTKKLIPLLALTLLLSGCGLAERFLSRDSQSAPEQAARIPTRGVWREGVFTSEYLGLTFQMPQDWTASMDPDVRELTDAEIFGTIATSPNEDASVHILFRRLHFLILGIDEHEYMASVAEQAGVDFDSFGMRRIGRYDWHVYGTVAGGNNFGRYFINIDDGFVRVISFLYTDQSKSLEEMLALFSPL